MRFIAKGLVEAEIIDEQERTLARNERLGNQASRASRARVERRGELNSLDTDLIDKLTFLLSDESPIYWPLREYAWELCIDTVEKMGYARPSLETLRAFTNRMRIPQSFDSGGLQAHSDIYQISLALYELAFEEPTNRRLVDISAIMSNGNLTHEEKYNQILPILGFTPRDISERHYTVPAFTIFHLGSILVKADIITEEEHRRGVYIQSRERMLNALTLSCSGPDGDEVILRLKTILSEHNAAVEALKLERENKILTQAQHHEQSAILFDRFFSNLVAIWAIHDPELTAEMFPRKSRTPRWLAARKFIEKLPIPHEFEM